MKGKIFSRWSNWIVVFNLALLAAFLFFWLRNEYVDEKESLEQSAHLQVADRIIKLTGLDLDSILQDLEGYGADSTLAIKYVTAIESGDLVTYGEPQLDSIYWDPDCKENIAMVPNKRHTIMKKQLPFGKGDSISTSISIFVTGDDTSDMQAVREAMDFSVQLKNEFEDNTEDLGGAAMTNILPQILFAIALWAMSVLTIVVLRRTFRERQRMLQSKNAMISNITHELKTPVATIGVALEAIQDFKVHADPQKANAYLSTARGELHRLSQSIDQVLQFSKMDQGAIAYHFEPISLKSLLQSAVKGMQLQLDQQKSDFEIQFEGENWDLEADELHLKNAINNLLDNSLKYSESGVRIRLKAKADLNDYFLEISDSGKGIPKPYQEKVFERFFRVPKGDTHNVKGYGLGLSYVKEIIQAHKGSIRLSSQEGAGTTIQIRLPKHHGA